MQSHEVYELTNPQKSIWFTEQYYKGTTVNNICGSVLIEQKVNIDLLNIAINKFIENNDSFKIRLKLIDGNVYQYFTENSTYDFEILNLKDSSEIEKHAKQMVSLPFEMIDSKLFDFKLFTLANGYGGFIVNAHHLISDAATFSFIATEVTSNYSMLLKNEPIPKKEYSYIDYINSEKDYLTSKRFEKDKAYWNELYSDIPEIASIPSFKNEPNSPLSNRLEFTFDENLLNKLNSYCKENKISLYNFLIAIYSIYIGRINNINCFSLGTPILNRTTFAEKHTAGMFISTSVLKINLDNKLSFGEFIQNISKTCMSMLRHQKYSYQYILEDLRKENKNLSNLYDIGFSYQITKATDIESSIPYTSKWYETPYLANNLTINFHDNDNTGNMLVEYDYRVCKYDDIDIKNIHNRIIHIINQVINNNDIELENISIITEEEKNEILYKFNNSKHPYPTDKTIIDLFEQQVNQHPDKIAVIFKQEKITYKELNEKANQLANYIINNYESYSNIAILLKRSIHTYISMLAVLKLGASYVLIDHKLPTDRINYMIKNSNSSLLISQEQFNNNINVDNTIIFENVKFLETLDKNNASKKIDVKSPCAIIYTSGSTGTPKGVILTHQGMVNMVYSYNHILKTDTLESFLSISTVAFDMFAVETYVPLLNGKQIVLASEDEQNSPMAWQNLIINNNIDFILTTPSKIELLLLDNIDKNCLKNIKVIQLGGEIFNPSLFKKLQKYTKANIFNGYGPTEATACCSTKNVCTDGIPNIGTPYCNTNLYICDETLNLLPVGIPGEICISGDGVSLGYINNEKVTKSAFVTNKFNDRIMYRTGDIGKFGHSGELEYIGRKDSQVKLRGLRIELNEIAHHITEIPQVDNCVVVIKKINGFDALCAYIKSSVNIETIKIKQYISKFLPNYMVPNFFCFIDEIPLTINGKIDYIKLPNVKVQENRSIEDNSSLTKEQAILKEICIDLLNIESMSINDNFFEEGGDSLFAIKLSSKIYSTFNIDLKIATIFENPTIKELSVLLSNENNSNIITKIEKADKQPFYPLSSGQKRIYYAYQKLSNSTVYNVTGAFLIGCILDKEKTEKAFQKIISNNIAFRTYFQKVDGVPMQFIIDSYDFKLDWFTEKTNNVSKLVRNFAKPFNLEQCPLLRVELHYLPNNQSVILIDSHHIILDGVSLDIFMRDFCKIYSGNSLEKNSIDYVDYSTWETKFNNSNEIENIEKYWIDNFKDVSNPILNLPYDYSDEENKTSIANRVSKVISQDMFRKLEHLSIDNNCSPYMLFLSAFLVLLNKYTGQNDIILGSPITGRYLEEIQNIIGMFTNNIVLKNNISKEATFKDLLKQTKQIVLDSLSYQPYPYDKLVEKLNIPNLLDVMFVYQNITKQPFIIDGHEIQTISSPSQNSKFNLLLEIMPNLNALSFEYNTDLFKEETINSLLEHYIFILEQLLNNIDLKIDDIEIITPNEKLQIEKFNNTYGEINNDTIISIFEEQVEKNKDKIALICEGKTLTYDELNKRANNLAHYLISKNIGNNDIVCIMTNRSFETIVSMLGILKAGAAFFNVDPTYPIDRTNYYIKDSNAQIVLTQSSLKNLVSQVKNCIEIDLDNTEIYNDENTSNPMVTHNPEDLSYIIYTSGSTGVPKGVMLNQVGFANMAKAMTLVLDYLKDGNKQTLLSVTSTPFDIFVYEIFVCLTHGLKIVIANNSEHRNPSLLENLIDKHSVSVMTVTPSLMKIIYDNRSENSPLSKVKNMVFGGEPLSEKFVNDLKALSNDITVYNIYGPSEITILSNVQNLDDEKEITVGPPILNTQMYILDENMKQVPVGVKGEIYIAGIQVGLGYIGKPELTNKRFLDNPFGEGKIYKSGDIGRWTFEGKIQCLGRVDHQVKLRGLRIELGEIEKQIERISGVSASVVNKIEIDNKESLCAYYVGEREISEKEIREHLKNNLPPYMIPSYIMQLKQMPYTINRKIDRKALPMPSTSYEETKTINIKNLSSNEDKLLHIWTKLLKNDNINIDDNFFDLGGDSISAINMQIEALKYGINFEYSNIFQMPTIRQLANIENQTLSKQNLDFIKNYDYTKINELLSNNNENNISKIKKAKFKNVLLTGATGYLGIHILNTFLKNEKGNIYCLIRAKNNIGPEDRLKNTLEFYFGNRFWKKYKNRIHIVEGDITDKKLGISKQNYKSVVDKIDVVINSGALVKHYGDINLFEEVNVKGTQNIVDFCKNENKRLLHISTVSVSGNGEKSRDVSTENQKFYKESDFYIGQSLDGAYSYTKFKSEMLVYNAILNGLDASVLRIGNIASRYSDGMFQRNIEDNAFVKRFKSFIEIGAIPNYSLEHELEFTPVDLCSEAIIKILDYKSNCNVFHIYDTKLIPIKILLEILKDLGIEITPVSNKLMTDIITGILEDDSRKDIISGIIYDLDKNKNLIYTSNILLDATFTEKYLQKIGFKWKKINKNYIIKYLNYLKHTGFIDF